MDKKITESGAKAEQRQDNDPREKLFQRWHRTLDKSWHFSDIDGVGWELVNNNLTPAFILDVTLADDNIQCVNSTYLNAITDRMFKRDMQGAVLRFLSKKLDVPGLIVLHRRDFSQFWAYDVATKKWQELNRPQWLEFEDGLRCKARHKKLAELEKEEACVL